MKTKVKVNLFYAVFFLSVFFVFFFSSACRNASAEVNLRLNGISVSKSKKSDSYFIWFKFNGNPQDILKNMSFKRYGIELFFNNARPGMPDASGINSKFISFRGNMLFKAAEIIPAGNSQLDTVIYFHKNIKIDKNDTFATYYRRYFVIKINHRFSSGIFKNVGNKPAAIAGKTAIANKTKAGKTIKAKKILPAGAKTVSADTSGSSRRLHFSAANGFSKKNEPGLNMGFEAVKTAVYLALIIGLIYGVYFLMNKLKNRVSVKEKLNNLQIISSINLGNKKSILLIEVNREFFLVGVSPSNIQVIGRLNGRAADEVAGVSGAARETAAKDTEAFEYGNASMSAGVAPFISPSPSPAIKTYDRFADVMRERVASRTGRPEQPANSFDKSGKIKNINEAKYKTKADNVFFDIEERLKGLMESNGKSKKF